MRSVTDVVSSFLCHGCGACEYYCPSKAIEMRNIPDVGYRPVIVDDGNCADCAKCIEVCSGIELDSPVRDDIVYGSQANQEAWGPVIGVYEGYSEIDSERFRGSSGGAGTAIGRYALESGLADAVLHVVGNDADPFTSKAVLSSDVKALQDGSGSRYNPVALCSALDMVDKFSGRVVIIGKPCDIASIRYVRQRDRDIDEKIVLTVSIFCGGTPSSDATRRLCERIEVNPAKVQDIRYRGHGWPGNFSVKSRGSDERSELSYQQAWDEELTRYVSFRCKMCPDGSGEYADISVGDPWYKKTSDPDAEGTSLIVVRTPEGMSFYKRMIDDRAVKTNDLEMQHLYDSQVGLHRRKKHVFIKMAWMCLLFMNYPRFGFLRMFKQYIQLDASRMLKTIYTTGKWIFSLK